VLDALTRLDYTTRFALVALSDSRGVAVARYAMLAPSASGSMAAEVAVVVAPLWRGVGLATALVPLLARRAQQCGITEFTALLLADHRPVTELAHEAPARMVRAW
jgi:GNAT superfamily N-acetyltransferase